MSEEFKNAFEFDILLEDLKLPLDDVIDIVRKVDKNIRDNVNLDSIIFDYALDDKKEQATLITLEIKTHYVSDVLGTAFRLLDFCAEKYIDFRVYPKV